MNKPPEISDEKQKALEAARLQIEKQFGKGSIMKLGEGTGPAAIPVIPTGSILLDAALGVGGYPRGRVIEIYGPESSGKTTLALHAIAEAQKLGGIAAFIDAEHALDPLYAKNLGVNVDELWVSQPDNGEQALEIVESLIRSGAMDIIVVDSVAALTPRAEIEGDMGDSHMGLQARLMSQALRKLTAIISKSRTCLIFINQIRMKIGVMFGNPETTTGGNALKFYASVRLEVRKIETISEGTEDVIGNKVRVKVVKNKVAPPFKRVELEIMFGKGISSTGSLLDAALQQNMIDKSGSWYSYGEERIGQGRENAKLFLESNPDIFQKLEQSLRKILFSREENKAPSEPKDSKDPLQGAQRVQGAQGTQGRERRLPLHLKAAARLRALDEPPAGFPVPGLQPGRPPGLAGQRGGKAGEASAAAARLLGVRNRPLVQYFPAPLPEHRGDRRHAPVPTRASGRVAGHRAGPGARSGSQRAEGAASHRHRPAALRRPPGPRTGPSGPAPGDAGAALRPGAAAGAGAPPERPRQRPPAGAVPGGAAPAGRGQSRPMGLYSFRIGTWTRAPKAKSRALN